jgi:hypothetical protein
MVIGLVEGLGKRFGLTLVISPLTQRNVGDDHDSFDIRILKAA